MSTQYRSAAEALVSTVTRVGNDFGLPTDSFPRLDAARAGRDLLIGLDAASTDFDRVTILAEALVGTSELGLGKSISTAQSVVAELDAAQLPIIKAAMAQPEGQHLGPQLTDALAAEELAVGLAPVLKVVQDAAIAIVTKPTIPVPPAPAPAPAPSHREWKGSDLSVARTQLDDIQKRIQDGALAPETVEILISWNEPDAAGPTE